MYKKILLFLGSGAVSAPALCMQQSLAFNNSSCINASVVQPAYNFVDNLALRAPTALEHAAELAQPQQLEFVPRRWFAVHEDDEDDRMELTFRTSSNLHKCGVLFMVFVAVFTFVGAQLAPIQQS